MHDYTIYDNGRELDNLSPHWFATPIEASRAMTAAMDDVCPQGSDSRRFIRGKVRDIGDRLWREIGTICHSDDCADDDDARRVSVVFLATGQLATLDGDGEIMPEPGPMRYSSSEYAQRRAAEIWGGVEWDWTASD